MPLSYISSQYTFRRRQKQKARKRSNIPLAPGKDDIDKIETENSRKHNQYSPPPTRECKPDDLYANLNKEGNPNESTDPALDAMGYLKTKIKQQKEPGSELYYETKSEKDMHKKKKGLKNKKGHKNKKRKKEKFDVNNEQQPVYENKDVHTNAAFEQPDYLDLTNSADNTKDDQHKVNGTTNNGYIEDDEYVDPDRSDKIHVTPETATSSHDKHSNHVKKDNAPVYKNENVKAKTDKTVEAKADKNVKAKTDKIPVSTDENDEEYEVPDNYPEPKKPPSRTYVTDTKHHKGNKSHVKEKTKTKEVKKVIGTNDNKANTDSGKQKEIKYENIKDSGKYVNVGETNELVSDDYYEVPENK